MAAGQLVPAGQARHSPAAEQTAPSPQTLPALRGTQVPGAAGMRHDSQAPRQARSQQVPASQKPEAQSSGTRQAPPLGFWPHEPAMHRAGATQSALPTQAVKHSVALHWNGAQMVVAPGMQPPLPSQVETALRTAMAQVAGAHSVPAGWKRQPPSPSQVPSLPQLDDFSSTQTLRGSGCPSPVFVHMPGAVGMAHERQAPLQASLQQTPSTQKPERHMVPVVQLAPSSLSPQLPIRQWPPAEQSASLRQVSRQPAAEQAKGAQSITAPPWQLPWPLQVPAKRSRLPSQAGGSHSVPAG